MDGRREMRRFVGARRDARRATLSLSRRREISPKEVQETPKSTLTTTRNAFFEYRIVASAESPPKFAKTESSVVVTPPPPPPSTSDRFIGIIDAKDDWCIGIEEGVVSFYASSSFLAILKDCRTTWCLSIFEATTATATASRLVYKATPRMQFHFAKESEEERQSNSSLPFLCVCSRIKGGDTDSGGIDSVFFRRLFGFDVNYPFLLYGNQQGLVRSVAVQFAAAAAAAASTPPDPDISIIKVEGGDDDFDWLSQVDPPVLCSIDEPIHSLHLLTIKIDGAADAVLVVGNSGKLTVVTSNPTPQSDGLLFKEYNVPGPVVAACITPDDHWLLHSTGETLYATNLVLSKDDSEHLHGESIFHYKDKTLVVDDSAGNLPLHSSLSSIKIPLAESVLWLGTGPKSSPRCVALTSDGLLYNVSWPLPNMDTLRDRMTLSDGSSQLESLIRDITASSDRMRELRERARVLDKVVRDLNVAFGILCDCVDGTAPLSATVRSVIRDRGHLGCNAGIDFCFLNGTGRDFSSPGWSITCRAEREGGGGDGDIVNWTVPISGLKSGRFARFDVDLPSWTDDGLLPFRVDCLLNYNFSWAAEFLPPVPFESAISGSGARLFSRGFDLLSFLRPKEGSSLVFPSCRLNVSKLLDCLQGNVASASGETSSLAVGSVVLSRYSLLLLKAKGDDRLESVLRSLLEGNASCEQLDSRKIGRQLICNLVTPAGTPVDLQLAFVKPKATTTGQLVDSSASDVDITVSSPSEKVVRETRMAIMGKIAVSLLIVFLEYGEKIFCRVKRTVL